jgi:hypothetical protein
MGECGTQRTNLSDARLSTPSKKVWLGLLVWFQGSLPRCRTGSGSVAVVRRDPDYAAILAEPTQQFDAEADPELEEQLGRELHGEDLTSSRNGLGSAKERRCAALHKAVHTNFTAAVGRT